jgi:hypothetical protein
MFFHKNLTPTTEELTMFHHDCQELDDDFGAWPNHHLSFSSFLGIVDGIQRIGQHVHSDHLEIWSDKLVK